LKLYPKTFIEELKTRSNIVDIISRYVQGVSKKGKSYFACCPFHHEKTPSFSINEYEQFYHCFGCGKSGDVIKFIEEIENVDYAEAVAILAGYANMSLPDLSDDGGRIAAQKKKKDRLLEILNAAARFYHSCLIGERGGAAREYLKKRRIDDALTIRFGLGYSPDYNALPIFLRGKGFEDAEILESGVCSKVRERDLIDAMAGRLVFPIINVYNEVIGFSGRILENREGAAKYKNTGATLIFDKSRSLYGINLLKKERQKNGINDVVLVEGHIDLVALSGAGIANAVASMGTAFTKYQAALIKRHSDKVFIAYDGDKAGQNAALKGLDVLEGEGLDVKVITLPEGLDPDDTVRKFGKEYFLDLKNKALPLYEYKIHALKKNYDFTSSTERGRFALKAAEILRPLGNDVLIEPYIGIVSEISGINYDTLRREFLKNADINPTHTQNNKGEVRPAEKNNANEEKYSNAVRFILNSMLLKKDFIDADFDVEPYISDITYVTVNSYLKECKIRGIEPRISGLFDAADENLENLDELNKIINLETVFKDAAAEKKYYGDAVNVLKKHKIMSEIERLKREYNEETDSERRKTITADILKLQKQNGK
jgi:DNA primase